MVTFPADHVENPSESMLPDRLFFGEKKCCNLEPSLEGLDGCSFAFLLPPETNNLNAGLVLGDVEI